MSYSSLWTIDKDFYGHEDQEYGNSHLFSPIAWDILFNKYLPSRANSSYGKMSFIAASMFDESIEKSLNKKINETDNESDRVVWEMTNQQIFFTKDKIFISDNIKKFVNEYSTDNFLSKDHIKERFLKIADDILGLDENESPYFIFKNTSVDDNVEYWFRSYDDETDEYINSPLYELEKEVTSVVVIEDNKIKGWVSNLNFFIKENVDDEQPND